MKIQIEDKVKKVMGNVFGIDALLISDETSPDTLLKWDSIGHMNLIFALEEEFNIQFSETQIVEMMNYPLILCVLKEIISYA